METSGEGSSNRSWIKLHGFSDTEIQQDLIIIRGDIHSCNLDVAITPLRGLFQHE